jgi:hypothetical protein
MSQTARLDPHRSPSRDVQFDQAAADRFFGRITIVAGTIAVLASLCAAILAYLG